MPGPTVTVEVAFNSGPYVASPTWTDITSDVREISIRRGRGDDFEQFDTGTAQLVLDNRARKYDPFYTSGTYYLKLTPRRQIRIRGTTNGVTYDVFRGYVAGWPVTWSDAGYDSTVTIQAFDALGLMANEVLPTDWPDFYTRSLSPVRYWKCNDARTSNTITDQAGVGTALNQTLGSGNTLYEVPALAEGLPSTGLFSSGGGSSSAQVTSTTDQRTQSLAFWFNIVTTGGIDETEARLIYWSNGMYYRFIYNKSGDSLVKLDISNRTNTRIYTFYNITRAQPAHLAFAVTPNAGGIPSATIYLNGTVITPTSVTSASGSGVTTEYILTGSLVTQEIAVFDYALSATQVAQIYNAGTARFSETTTARMNRLIGTTSFPAGLQSFTASPAATVAEIGTGTGVIPEMQLVADSEGGEIYVSKAGVLTTTNRTDVWTATRSATSQATFTDSGTGLKYGTDVSIELDGDNLKNDVTIQFSGDGEVYASNAAVIAAYGAAATTIETQLADPTSAQQLALMELGVEGSLVPRISPIDVSVNTGASDWQTILGLELLDRVTFKRTPSVGNQFSQDALINAIEHQIVPGVWNTQLTLSMRYTTPLICDDDIFGTVDFNYCG
mgnify:CR=1 FL=1